jgi:hypothetical protein
MSHLVGILVITYDSKDLLEKNLFREIRMFYRIGKLRTFSKQGSKVGVRTAKKTQLLIDDFPPGTKRRNGGFRYPIEHFKTVQKWNVFYTGQK